MKFIRFFLFFIFFLLFLKLATPTFADGTITWDGGTNPNSPVIFHVVSHSLLDLTNSHDPINFPDVSFVFCQYNPVVSCFTVYTAYSQNITFSSELPAGFNLNWVDVYAIDLSRTKTDAGKHLLDTYPPSGTNFLTVGTASTMEPSVSSLTWDGGTNPNSPVTFHVASNSFQDLTGSTNSNNFPDVFFTFCSSPNQCFNIYAPYAQNITFPLDLPAGFNLNWADVSAVDASYTQLDGGRHLLDAFPPSGTNYLTVGAATPPPAPTSGTITWDDGTNPNSPVTFHVASNSFQELTGNIDPADFPDLYFVFCEYSPESQCFTYYTPYSQNITFSLDLPVGFSLNWVDVYAIDSSHTQIYVGKHLLDTFPPSGTSYLTVSAATPTPTPTPINVAPVVGAIATPSNPVQVNTSINTHANFTDANTTDTHTASWNWGDGSTQTSGTVTEPNGSTPGSVTGSHTYTTLGSYAITLTVTDNGGLSNASQKVVAIIPTSGLQGGSLSHTNYTGADLSGQNISKANLSVATFNNVNFQSANLSQVNGSNSSFTNDNFTSANLNKANFSNSNLTGSNFTNAIVTQANLSNANLTNVNFTGANLQGSNLSGTIKTGIIWSNTTCPNNSNSNNHNNSCVGQGGGL